MKNIFIFLFCVTSFNIIYAQENDNILSGKSLKNHTGLSIGFMNSKHLAIIDNKRYSSNYLTPSLGLLFTRDLSKRFELSFEDNLLLNSGIENTFDYNGSNISYKYNPVIMSLSFKLRYKFKRNRTFNGVPNFIHIGPAINYDVNNRNSITNSNIISNGLARNYIKFNALSSNISIGAGYNFTLKYVNLRTEFNYINDFNRMVETNFTNLNFSKIRNSGLFINLILENRLMMVKEKKSQKSWFKRYFKR
jgi:hypothetical protein